MEGLDLVHGRARLQQSNAVQVVDFMLEATTQKTIAFQLAHFAIKVVETNTRNLVARYRNGNARKRKAAFLSIVRFRFFDDLTSITSGLISTRGLEVSFGPS